MSSRIIDKYDILNHKNTYVSIHKSKLNGSTGALVKPAMAKIT
jgi:hypothetical protein